MLLQTISMLVGGRKNTSLYAVCVAIKRRFWLVISLNTHTPIHIHKNVILFCCGLWLFNLITESL